MLTYIKQPNVMIQNVKRHIINGTLGTLYTLLYYTALVRLTIVLNSNPLNRAGLVRKN